MTLSALAAVAVAVAMTLCRLPVMCTTGSVAEHGDRGRFGGAGCSSEGGSSEGVGL